MTDTLGGEGIADLRAKLQSRIGSEVLVLRSGWV